MIRGDKESDAGARKENILKGRYEILKQGKRSDNVECSNDITVPDNK